MQSWLKKIDRYTRICVTVFHRIICLSNQLIILKGVFQKYHFAKFCIVFNFSWDLQSPQEKLKTVIMHNFGGTTNSVVFLKKKSLFILVGHHLFTLSLLRKLSSTQPYLMTDL